MSDKAEFQGARNFMLRNCTLEYVKITRLVTYQGAEQWELSITTENPEQAEYWETNHLNVKDNAKDVGKGKPATKWHVPLNRKAFTKDGTANDPVGAVWANMKALTAEERRQIGNKSKGNVVVWQGHYDNSFGKGVTTSLTKIQITEFDKYEGGLAEMEFDVEDPEGADEQFTNETEGGDTQSESKDLF